eukprot:GGOE01013702.1.p1 GENE.GGOE01013702.1~~GGOE01013702.1.p1  ORF type:complete len:175 (-),score=32.35 GGOE01013702.1:294-794(-)
MDTSPPFYEAALHSGIPISQHMGLKILALDSKPFRITVSAPLEANVNVHGTGFAGSLYSLAVLTAWTIVHHFLRCEFPMVHMELVVRDASIRYHRPVEGDIVCHCSLAEDALATFKATLLDKQKARMVATTVIPVSGGDTPAAVLEAQFTAWVASKPQPPSASSAP